MTSRTTYPIRYDHWGIAVTQYTVNGFDITYNPDDQRWYICDHNEYGDLETRSTYDATRPRSWGKVLHYCRHHVARNPQ